MEKHRHYRRRRSKFDPYMDEFIEMLETGCTYRQIADAMEQHFDDGTTVSESQIWQIVHNRGLKSQVTQGSRNGRIYIPRCENCDKCLEVLNTTKVSTVRVCTELCQIISRSCLTSPMDCPKRHSLEKKGVKENGR